MSILSFNEVFIKVARLRFNRNITQPMTSPGSWRHTIDAARRRRRSPPSPTMTPPAAPGVGLRRTTQGLEGLGLSGYSKGRNQGTVMWHSGQKW